MKPIRNVFFIGSSGVGKSTLAARMVADYPTALSNGQGFHQIRARDVHATIKGFSFEKAMTDPMATISFQYAIGQSFSDQCLSMVNRTNMTNTSPLAVAERFLLDVAGYTGAFARVIEHKYENLLETDEVLDVALLNTYRSILRSNQTLKDLSSLQMHMALNFLTDKVFPVDDILLIHVPINPYVPYATEAARPPEVVRNHCARFLNRWFDFFQSEIENNEEINHKNIHAARLNIGDLDAMYAQVQQLLEAHGIVAG